VQYRAGLAKSHNINASVKMQRVTFTFSAVQQDCLNLKMALTRPFKASVTASQPTRTEQRATPLTEPEITQE
jgi:hypothetical protein